MNRQNYAFTEKDLSIRNIEIHRQWLDIAKSYDSKDGGVSNIAISFVAYWIAFNAIYIDDQIESERVQIISLIEKIFKGPRPNKKAKLLEEFLKWVDSEKSGIARIFFKNPVFRGEMKPDESMDYKIIDLKNKANLHNREKGYYYIVKNYQDFTNDSNSTCRRLQGLMLMIYQVRCNLFHASKLPTPNRNYELVNASQVILGKFLENII